MNVNQIELSKTGVLFFDMVNGSYHAAEPATKARMKPMVDNAMRLVTAGRQAGIPIFFAKSNHRADGATSALLLTDTNVGLKPWPNGVVTKERRRLVAGENSSEIIPELDPRPTDNYVPKYRWNAFHETYLDLALRARSIDTVIISGNSTDVGIAATVFAGRDMNYHMIVVRDACATAHDQRSHDQLMELMFPRMSRVSTTDDVLRMIREASFK